MSRATTRKAPIKLPASRQNQALSRSRSGSGRQSHRAHHPRRDAVVGERRALAFWRTLAPGQIGTSRRHELERVLGLSRLAAAGGRRLHARAHSALVIGAAVDVLVRRAALDTTYADFIMSCLLAHALRRDAAAPFILAHALARLSRQSPRHARCQDLSNQWRQWRPRPVPAGAQSGEPG
ncbi:hypothetical protein [Microvirga soli]|uniref:hypothetical protein n=1 Tax=Microvirga soli TaxID=1854496 RepID=UPI00191E5F46|nr:hypothetical protein [Microvirga soli]